MLVKKMGISSPSLEDPKDLQSSIPHPINGYPDAGADNGADNGADSGADNGAVKESAKSTAPHADPLLLLTFRHNQQQP